MQLHVHSCCQSVTYFENESDSVKRVHIRGGREMDTHGKTRCRCCDNMGMMYVVEDTRKDGVVERLWREEGRMGEEGRGEGGRGGGTHL